MLLVHSLASISALVLLTSCASSLPSSARIGPTPPHLRLKSSSDAEILRQIGFDHTKMKAHFVQGPDGYGTDYEARNHEWVSITRSVVSGIFVMFGDQSGQKGSWTLGFRHTADLTKR